MKKLMLFAITMFLLTSCVTEKPLYSWYTYEKSSYNYLKNSDDKSVEDLITSYQSIIEKQKGTRKVVPPGVYADYGFILIQANKVKEGKAMLLKEVELYPESKVFVDRILKMIEK